MSSPYPPPVDGFPGRVGVSSPVQDPGVSMYEGVSLRPMRRMYNLEL